MNIQLQRDIFSIKPGPLGPTHMVRVIAYGCSFPECTARSYERNKVSDQLDELKTQSDRATAIERTI
jgi:hypothetical protein